MGELASSFPAYDYRIWRLLAGDAKTQSRIVVLRGIEKLRELNRHRTDAESLVLADWWREFQSDRFQSDRSWELHGVDRNAVIAVNCRLRERGSVNGGAPDPI